jgi:hypothetical protein
MQGTQGIKALHGLPLLQGTQKMDGGISNTQPAGGCHFLDAVGMEMGTQKGPHFLQGRIALQNILHDGQQFIVPVVKKESRSFHQITIPMLSYTMRMPWRKKMLGDPGPLERPDHIA